ncbi:MAG: nicotinamidase [Bacteroidetes bacterium]|nr:MAG: nicotinamidase [Bacteroidota bacterium]
MRKKNALLIIDAQHDFCNPKGSLFVQGADQDMVRLSAFIDKNKANLDHICATLDNHPIHDISHPAFWKDSQGNSPAPFTQITSKEVLEGKWIALFEPQKALIYLQELEKQGKFLHFIWTTHCLTGSLGASLDETLMKSLINWSKNGREYQTVVKGTYPFTEHFGIFMAQIPYPDRPETQLNQTLINSLDAYEHIYLAGEAKSHCVATSLQQLMDYAPKTAQKIIVIQDCMSDVTGLGHLGKPTYDQAAQLGINFVKAAEVNLN